MCNGKCGKCKKAEFETTDVQVESLGQRSGVIVDGESARGKERSDVELLRQVFGDIRKDHEFNEAIKSESVSYAVVSTIGAMIRAGYRK